MVVVVEIDRPEAHITRMAYSAGGMANHWLSHTDIYIYYSVSPSTQKNTFFFFSLAFSIFCAAYDVIVYYISESVLSVWCLSVFVCLCARYLLGKMNDMREMKKINGVFGK